MVRACESYSSGEQAGLWLASSTLMVSATSIVAGAVLSRYTQDWKPYLGIGFGSVGFIGSSYALWKISRDERANIIHDPPPFPKNFFNTETELGVPFKEIPDKYFVRFHCRQGGEDARYAAYYLDLLPDTCPGCCEPLSEKDQRILHHATHKIKREEVDAFIQKPLVPTQHVSNNGTVDWAEFWEVPGQIRVILPSGHIEAVPALKKSWEKNPDLDGHCLITKTPLPPAYVRKIKAWQVPKAVADEWKKIKLHGGSDPQAKAKWTERVGYFKGAACDLAFCENFETATPTISWLQENLRNMPKAEERFFHDLVIRPKGQPSLRVGSIWARFTAIAELEETQQGPAIRVLSVALWDLWHRLQTEDQDPPEAIRQLLPMK